MEPTIILAFTVRNDKFRGLVIEKFARGNNECFFKYQDQPVQRHCQEIQKIVRSADVKRSKLIRIDVAEFYYEYFFKNKPTFRGCPLSTSHCKIEKMCASNVNKEVGAVKRSITIAQKKSKKIEERNSKIETKMQLAEEKFQISRAKKIHELFGLVNPASGTSRNEDQSAIPETPQIVHAFTQLRQEEPIDAEHPSDDEDL